MPISSFLSSRMEISLYPFSILSLILGINESVDLTSQQTPIDFNPAPLEPCLFTTMNVPPHSPLILSVPQEYQRSVDPDDQEILIDFKPAPVSPDARALLNRISQTTRRFLPLQKTFSDGEIRVERRELVGEAGELSYPHTCRRNHQDPWGRTVRASVQFSSTPEDLFLLRVASPHEDHHEEASTPYR